MKYKNIIIFTLIFTLNISARSGFSTVQTQPSDEKIVTAGFHDINNVQAFLVNRYTTTGALDTTFNQTGFNVTPIGSFASAQDLVIQSSNERIIVGGYAFTGATVAALTRYLSTGPLDQSFGGGGIVTTVLGQGAQINGLALQSDGKIVTCGTTIMNGSPQIFLARYNANGTLDSDFGTQGIVTTSIGTKSGGISVTLQPGDEKIVISAFVDFDSFAVLRYNTNGTLDTTFGTNGATRTILGNYSRPFSIALQNNGKFILAGQSEDHITLIRYNVTGVIDTSFGNSGIVTTQLSRDSIAHSVAITSSDSIIIGGTSDDKIVKVKYTPTGVIEQSFGKDGIFLFDFEIPAQISDITVKPSTTGVIAAGGRVGKGIIIQVSPTGILDCSFNDNGIVLFPEDLSHDSSYAFAASTSTQSLGITFANITFDLNGPLKNWIHTPGGSTFKCLRSGTYLITYSGVYTEASLIALSNISVIALRNGIEVAGSQINTNLSVGIGSINVKRSMIVTLCKNDEVRFQHRRSSGIGTISLQALGFGTTPIGATVTINLLS